MTHMHCTNAGQMVKLLTSIEEERNRRNFKCSTSYHVCFLCEIKWHRSLTHFIKHFMCIQRKTKLAHTSHFLRGKNRGEGWLGRLYLYGIFSPGRWLKQGLKAHPGAKASRADRTPFSPGSSHDPGLKVQHDPGRMLHGPRAASWPVDPGLMLSLVPVRDSAGAKAQFRAG